MRVLILCVVLACAVSARAADDDESNEKEQPITRDQLNAIMKHPTEPDYDPLRPMSGRWVRCQNSRQDRFSSTDRSHFTRTISFAADTDCKNSTSEERSTYECTSIDKKNLRCKMTKREQRVGSGSQAITKVAWSPLAVAPAEPTVKLSFSGVETSKKKKKTKPSDKLTLHLVPEGGESQTFELEFVPSAPRATKTND